MREMAKKEMPAELLDAAMQRRSTLFAWMVRNHDEFAEVIADAIRPNWHGIARVLFDREGLTDAERNAPSGDVARRTWWKARRHVGARRAGKPPRVDVPANAARRPAAEPEQTAGLN